MHATSAGLIQKPAEADAEELQQVSVPDGVAPGDEFTIELPDGRVLTIECPDGVSSGGVLEIAVPPVDEGQAIRRRVHQSRTDAELRSASIDLASPSAGVETAEVPVPAGVGPGETFSVQTAWGEDFEVEVPDGTEPGSTLFIELPRALRPIVDIVDDDALGV